MENIYLFVHYALWCNVKNHKSAEQLTPAKRTTTHLLPWSTRYNQLPPLSWGFLQLSQPHHWMTLPHPLQSFAVVFWKKTLPWRWAKKKGIQNSSVFFIDQTKPSPVALLAPLWTRCKPFAPAVSFESASASASPNHLRISFNLPWNCSHVPGHCHPHYQAQAFTKHYQPSWRPQWSRAYGTTLPCRQAFQLVKFTVNISLSIFKLSVELRQY